MQRPGEIGIPTSYTHEHIGTMIGANREAVTRAFGRLQDEGVIHYNAPNVRRACLRSTEERFLVTTERGAYPHTDDGVEVRRIFHKLRSVANENFNEHFKAIFEVCTGRFPPEDS